MVGFAHRSGWLLLQSTAPLRCSSGASSTGSACQFLSVPSSRKYLLRRCDTSVVSHTAGCISAGCKCQNSSCNPRPYKRLLSYIMQPFSDSQHSHMHCSNSGSNRTNNRRNKSSNARSSSSSESNIGSVQTIRGKRKNLHSGIKGVVVAYVKNCRCYSSFISRLRYDPSTAAATAHCSACRYFSLPGVPRTAGDSTEETRTPSRSIWPTEVGATQIAATTEETASTGRCAASRGAADASGLTADVIAGASVPGVVGERVDASPARQATEATTDTIKAAAVASRDATAGVASLSKETAERRRQLMRMMWRFPRRPNRRCDRQRQLENPLGKVQRDCEFLSASSSSSSSSRKQHRRVAVRRILPSMQHGGSCSNWREPAPLKTEKQEWEQQEQSRIQEQQQQRRASLSTWPEREFQEKGYCLLEQQQHQHSTLLQRHQEKEQHRRMGRQEQQQHQQKSEKQHQQQVILHYQKLKLHARRSHVPATVSSVACEGTVQELEAVEAALLIAAAPLSGSSYTTPVAMGRITRRAAMQLPMSAAAGSHAITVGTPAAAKVVDIEASIAGAAGMPLRLPTAALEATESPEIIAGLLAEKHPVTSVLDGEETEAAAEHSGHAAATSVACRLWEAEKSHLERLFSRREYNVFGEEASVRHQRRLIAPAAIRQSLHTTHFSSGLWFKGFSFFSYVSSVSSHAGVSRDAAAATPALIAALIAGSSAVCAGTAAGPVFTAVTPTTVAAFVTAVAAAVKLLTAVAAAATAACFNVAAARGTLAASSSICSSIRPAGICLPYAAGAFHSSAVAAASPSAAQLLHRRWWTRASGMRKPVKWTRDWEVLNRKVYYAFDEKDIRRSLLDTIASQRSCCSVFYTIIDLLPPLIHTLSLPGPFTVFVPTNEALSPQSRSPLPALAELWRSIRLLLRQRQSLQQQQQQQPTRFQSAAAAAATGSRVLPEGGAGTGSSVESDKEEVEGRALTAAGELIPRAAEAEAAEQLRLFVLAHVVPGEFRLKALLTEGSGGSKVLHRCRPPSSVQALRLFAPMILPTTPAGNSPPQQTTQEKRERASVYVGTENKPLRRRAPARGVGGGASPDELHAARAAFISTLSDKDDVGFWLPPSLAGNEHPLLVTRSPSIFAEFMSLAASNNLPQVQSQHPPQYHSERRDEMTGRQYDRQQRIQGKSRHAEDGKSRISASSTATTATTEQRREGKRRYLSGLTHITVGDSLIVKSDLRAHNGVVHLVDKPILPHILKMSSGR